MFDFLPYYTPELLFAALVIYLIWLGVQKAREPEPITMKMLTVCYVEEAATYNYGFQIQPKLQAAKDGTLVIYLYAVDVRKHMEDIDGWNEYFESKPESAAVVNINSKPLPTHPWDDDDWQAYFARYINKGSDAQR